VTSWPGSSRRYPSATRRWPTAQLCLAALFGGRWTASQGSRHTPRNAGCCRDGDPRRTRRPVFGPPKSRRPPHASDPGPLTEFLAKHLVLRGLTGADADALVFTAPAVTHSLRNWRNRVWLPACRAVGLDGLGFHDLRRANATALVRLGVDVKTAQQRLGHSDVRMTSPVCASRETCRSGGGQPTWRAVYGKPRMTAG